MFEPTGSSSVEQFRGIAIPIFGSSPRASGGSGEGGRGIGEENLGAIVGISDDSTDCLSRR